MCRSVIEDLELERVVGPTDDDLGRRASGVPEHVRERFLDDPVRGDRDAARDWARPSLDGQLDVDAGLADLFDQGRELGHAGPG